jgi:hypothetical protein
MTRTTCICLILAAGLVAGGAPAASLDRAGTWTSAGSTEPAAALRAPTLINDGSFELGPPPASAWTELNDSDCERIGVWSGEWYVSALDGDNDFWAGGYCTDSGSGENVPINASVTQTVLVPSGSTTLSFYYIAFRPDSDDDPPDGDRAYVAVNGTETWTLPLIQNNNTYPSWTGPITVDLSAYAGQSISLTFGGVGVGTSTGNARFDLIELIAPPETAAPEVVQQAGLPARLLSVRADGGQVHVDYALSGSAEARISIFDLLGRRVTVLDAGGEAGAHHLDCDLGPASSGIYFLRLQAGGGEDRRSFVLLH